MVTHELATALLGAGAAEIPSEGVRIGAVTRSGSEFELHPLLSEFLITQLQDDPDSGLKKWPLMPCGFLSRSENWDQAFHVIWSLKTSHLLPDLLTVALDDLLREGRTQTVVQWLDLAEANHLTSPVIDLAASEIGFREGLYAKLKLLRSQPYVTLRTELRARALIRAGQSAMLDSRDEQALPFSVRRDCAARVQYARLEALVGEYLTHWSSAEPRKRKMPSLS